VPKAVIIRTDGSREVAEFDNSTCYEVLSGAVEGLIECVPLLDQKTDLWVNEEGKLNGLDQNEIATKLWVDNYGYTDVIVGNVVVTGGTDDEGYTLGLTDEQVDYYLNQSKGLHFLGDIDDTIKVSVI
jgi:Domain of unknown function (DUF3846)